MENEEKILAESLDKLSAKAAKLNSLSWSFVRGIFFGLGSAIGAGVIAAIVVGALNWFLHSFEDVPVLRNLDRIEMNR